MIFDNATATRFNGAYVRAAEAGAEAFTFDGQLVLVAYAKYFVEYLKMIGLLKTIDP